MLEHILPTGLGTLSVGWLLKIMITDFEYNHYSKNSIP